MRKFSDEIKAYLSGNPNITFCFDFTLSTGEKLYLTNLQHEVLIDKTAYLPYSAIRIHKAHFDDGAKDTIELHGIFEGQGITTEHLLNGVQVKISASFHTQDKLTPLFTCYCLRAEVYKLEFYLYLAPLSFEFTRVFTERYSPTCRTEFGDQRCKVDKLNYSKNISIKAFDGDKAIVADTELSNDNYYTYGEIMMQYNSYNFTAKIINQLGNHLELDKMIPKLFRSCKEAIIIAGCDKEFLTCCNKFKNVGNFRGEPFISELKTYTLTTE